MVSTIHSLVTPLAVLMLILSTILSMRVKRELDAIPSTGNQQGPITFNSASNMSALHHQFFPNSRLGLALNISRVACVLLMIVWAVTQILIR